MYAPDPAIAGATGDVEALALHAGQSAGIVNHLLPAVAIVDQLTSGAAEALRHPRARR